MPDNISGQIFFNVRMSWNLLYYTALGVFVNIVPSAVPDKNGSSFAYLFKQ